MLVLSDINKQLLHVLQTFKQQTDKLCRVCGSAGVLGRDMEIQSGITRDHVRHSVAIIRNWTEPTTRAQLSNNATEQFYPSTVRLGSKYFCSDDAK